MTPLADGYLEARRQELLEAAARVFVTKGYAAATVNDIAAEAGVATGSIYRYFPSKADLIAEVAGHCVQDDVERWKTATGGATPGETLLQLGDLTRADFKGAGHRDEATLRLESYLAGSRDPALRDRITASLDESTQSLAGFFQRAQASGEFDPTWDAQDLARFLHVVGSGIGAMSVIYGDELDTDRVWDVLVRLVAQHLQGDLAAQAVSRAVGEIDSKGNN